MIRSEVIRIALLFVQSDENATLSYQHGWPRAFLESSLFVCTPINLVGLTFADHLAVIKRLHTGRYDAIVLLHSVFSNQNNLRGMLFWAVAACKVPKVYFIGNEYKLMPEKIRFCQRLGVSLLVTQSNDDHVQALYSKALNCSVICIPNTGIDTKVFRPMVSSDKRLIDIGYRSNLATWYLGNNEKTEIANYFILNAERYCLKIDISLSPQDRFDTTGYAKFLNYCRGQIGTEPGGDYFELTDNTRKQVNAYLLTYPDSTWPEIKRLFFDNYGQSVPMRIISGRQVEAAACKTVQILLEGRYNGYFQPDIHYISLAKDYSNIDEIIEKFRDQGFCRKLADNAYDVVMTNLTYEQLLATFAIELRQVL
jgi:hypothetical protein